MQEMTEEEERRYRREMLKTKIIGYVEAAVVGFIFFLLIPFAIFYGLWILLLPTTFWEKITYLIVSIILVAVVDLLAMYIFLAWVGEI